MKFTTLPESTFKNRQAFTLESPIPFKNYKERTFKTVKEAVNGYRDLVLTLLFNSNAPSDFNLLLKDLDETSQKIQEKILAELLKFRKLHSLSNDNNQLTKKLIWANKIHLAGKNKPTGYKRIFFDVSRLSLSPNQKNSYCAFKKTQWKKEKTIIELTKLYNQYWMDIPFFSVKDLKSKTDKFKRSTIYKYWSYISGEKKYVPELHYLDEIIFDGEFVKYKTESIPIEDYNQLNKLKPGYGNEVLLKWDFDQAKKVKTELISNEVLQPNDKISNEVIIQQEVVQEEICHQDTLQHQEVLQPIQETTEAPLIEAEPIPEIEEIVCDSSPNEAIQPPKKYKFKFVNNLIVWEN